MESKTVLEEANEIIYGDRERTYGNPAKNFKSIANLWTGYLRSKYDTPVILDTTDIAMMMIMLKIAREINLHTRDNIVDIAGYAGCIQKMEDYANGRTR